jgi:hypothetical protein
MQLPGDRQQHPGRRWRRIRRRESTNRLGGALDVDSMEAYLAAHSPVASDLVNRITLVP